MTDADNGTGEVERADEVSPRVARPEGADILMITHQRPEYVRLALPALLESCGPDDRVWLWHNGMDLVTLETSRSYADHPRVHRFHHSPENVSLREPTNWLWREADGAFVSKVDDDCIVDPAWLTTLKAAHRDWDGFGVLGTWRFYDEDFRPELANRKIATFPGGHRLMQNLWVQGSGYLVRREHVLAHGPIGERDSFPAFCMRLAKATGLVNGWYFPFVHEEHMDDPRSEHCLMVSDETFRALRPLSAAARGVETLDAWRERMKRSAWEVQRAPLDHRRYGGWRAKRSAVKRAFMRTVLRREGS
ncbi:MAG: glycosyltransferase [Frankiales bacterium]|nr:glycosyltransferase [Frankiales bacterium]